MNELDVEHALDVLNRKIAKYIRENKENDIEEFSKRLKEFTEEENKIYELDQETIERVLKEYLKNIKSKGGK